MTVKTESKNTSRIKISREDEELNRCRGRFSHFLKYVITNDTQRNLGEMPFPDYPYLMKMADDLQDNRLNLIFKPRQMLITWLLAAKRIWKANFHPYSNPLVLSQGELYAQAFLDRAWFIYERLPEFLRADAIKTAGEIKWPKLNSSIISLPCTKKAGRSLSSPDVTMDEAAFFEWGSETYAAVAPIVDKYGSLDICSTPNGKDPLFYELWTDPNFAKKFNKIDLKWMDHPERDDQWKQEIIAMIGLKRWLREYEKFWFAPLGKAVFEANWHDKMEMSCFDEWKDSDLIITGWDRGYHHPAILWTFMNKQDQWVKGIHYMASDMQRESFIKSAFEQTEALFPGKAVVHWVPPDFGQVDSDGKSWLEIMRGHPYKMNVKVGKAGKDEVVRRTDAQRNFMKLRQDRNFGMLVDPRCDVLLEGYKGGYCYPKAINKPEDEKPEKDGWYDHLQDCDAVIADNHFREPKQKEERRGELRVDPSTGMSYRV